MIYESKVQHLRADVAALATPAGRLVGSAGHARAREFLCKRMSSLGLEPYNGAGDYVLPYQSGGQQFFNLVGVIPGADRQVRPVLLGAHCDKGDACWRTRKSLSKPDLPRLVTPVFW